MSQAKWLENTVPIRVSKDTKAELEAIQQQFREETGGKLTADEVIRRLLAGRKPDQP